MVQYCDDVRRPMAADACTAIDPDDDPIPPSPDAPPSDNHEEDSDEHDVS